MGVPQIDYIDSTGKPVYGSENETLMSTFLAMTESGWKKAFPDGISFKNPSGKDNLYVLQNGKVNSKYLDNPEYDYKEYSNGKEYFDSVDKTHMNKAQLAALSKFCDGVKEPIYMLRLLTDTQWAYENDQQLHPEKHIKSTNHVGQMNKQ